EPLGKREGVGGGAGKAHDHVALCEAADLAGAGFHHRVARGDLAVAGDDDLVALAHGEDGGGTPLFCRHDDLNIGAPQPLANRGRGPHLISRARACYHCAALASERPMRTATVERKTRETEIAVSLDLDGAGECDIDTGIGFLDHMLESFGRHSMMDLKVRATGDLHVDFHHTTEDTAIVIVQAIKQALGDFSGITRFGLAVIPMDEALTRVALDLSNRPYLIWKVAIPKPKLGEMDTELFKEWCQALALNSGSWRY